MKNFIKKYTKYFIIICLVIICSVIYLFDFLIARSYDFEILSMTPEFKYADPNIPVDISIRLSRNGVPVSGHDLYALPTGDNIAGVFKQNRIRTDENGIANFTYYPYRATMFVKAAPVDIKVIDESNSVIFVINAEFIFTIDLVEQEV